MTKARPRGKKEAVFCVGMKQVLAMNKIKKKKDETSVSYCWTKYTHCHNDAGGGETTITWDSKIITDKSLEHNMPDIVVLVRKKKKDQSLDITVHYDTSIVLKTIDKDWKV
eukprot:14093361-Ditylum_brightwellii.AAC.1